MQQDNIDVFTGGVRPDGLKKKSDIKVLVCFLLRHCTQPLSRKEMTDIFLDKVFSLRRNRLNIYDG